jgi:hypothetical protein
MLNTFLNVQLDVMLEGMVVVQGLANSRALDAG